MKHSKLCLILLILVGINAFICSSVMAASIEPDAKNGIEAYGGTTLTTMMGGKFTPKQNITVYQNIFV